MTKLFPCMPFLCCRPSSPLPQHTALVFSANAMTVSSWVFSISPALAFPIWYFLKTRRPAHHLQHNLMKNSFWRLMPLPIFFFFSSWAFVHSKFDDVWLSKFVEDPQEIQSWSILEWEEVRIHLLRISEWVSFWKLSEFSAVRCSEFDFQISVMHKVLIWLTSGHYSFQFLISQRFCRKVPGSLCVML
jgi:hypothetical protein